MDNCFTCRFSRAWRTSFDSPALTVSPLGSRPCSVLYVSTVSRVRGWPLGVNAGRRESAQPGASTHSRSREITPCRPGGQPVHGPRNGVFPIDGLLIPEIFRAMGEQ